MKQQKSSMVQNQWDSAKPLLKGKFMTQAYFRKQEISNHLTLQTKPNVSRRKEIIKIRALIKLEIKI